MQEIRTERARRAGIGGGVLLLALTASGEAGAGRLLDYIRSYDLNDYSLGVALSASESPYVGGDSAAFPYPYLTSFRHSAFTRDWLLIRDGTLGLRAVTKGGWEFGLVGRVQTAGIGASEVPVLRGIDEREWTVEMAPMLGFRAWPVQFHAHLYADVLGRHDGYSGELAVSLPVEGRLGYLVPSLRYMRYSDDFNAYYYGVSPQEANPIRSAYDPGESGSAGARITFGYRVSPRWLLSGHVDYEDLPDEVRDSPLVGRNHVWSAGIGLAYNADIFQTRDRAGGDDGFEIRLGVFRDFVESRIERSATNGEPGDDVDIEDVLGASEDSVVMQADAFYRFDGYHRLELGYFEIGRRSATTLAEDIRFGNLVLPAGTGVSTHSSTQSLRAAYSYSLMRDNQKELALTGGLHYTTVETRIATDTPPSERVRVNALLPVLGAYGSVAVGQSMQLGARVQFFRMEFDRYRGRLDYASLELLRRITASFAAGLAYNYYGLRLESAREALRGELLVRHHGPAAFLSLRF